MPNNKKVIVAFCMDLIGHFQRLLPVISNLANEFEIHFFADSRYREQIEQAGATFVDMFKPYPLRDADQESFPLGCRFVSYTGMYIEPILEDIRALEPCLIIYDSFAVIGYAVAKVLGLPFINICAGHNINAANIQERVKYHPYVKISDACSRAVVKLRETYGIEAADPFLYACSVSPYLNIYSEPPRFLAQEDRSHYEPIAFFGCLDAEQSSLQKKNSPRVGFISSSETTLKIYVSFGTIIWIYFAHEAAQVLQAIADTFSGMENTEVLISLGGRKESECLLQSLARDNVKVHFYIDQWKVLQDADLFITHHGLNSTHEAIFHCVPMISYPFFWDQPALAEKCQELGLALPLTTQVRKPVTEDDVRNCFAEFMSKRQNLLNNIGKASGWEKQIIQNRPEVIRRIKNITKS